jgi:hypothetical protein
MVSWSPKRNSPPPSNWSPSKFNFSPKKSPPRKEGTKEERRKAYEKKLKNIANEAARTINVKNLKGMSNADIIKKYGKTRGEALIAKKAQNYEKSNEYKKQKDAMNARQRAADKEERKLAYAQKMKNIQKKAVSEIAAETLEDMTNEEIVDEYGQVRANVLIKERNKLKKKKISEEEKYTKELAAEQKRRDEDRAKSKKDQEKQRKEFEKEQQRQEEEYKKQLKRFETGKKQKPKTPLTPVTTLKAGSEQFKMASKITKCSRVLTLEQRDAPTCWFNALMMALFFSQNARIAVASSIPYIKDKRKDPLIVKIGKILEGYNKTRASEYLYKRLQPKEFLETIRSMYPEQFPTLKFGGKLELYRGDAMEYMHRMLQFLEIPHLMLSRQDMRSSRTEWSHYNYDMYENKIFDDAARGKAFGARKNISTYPKFVDTHRPVILTILTDYKHDKRLTEKAGKAWIKYKTYSVEGFYTDTHASKIKYNGETYYLDSMILGSYNSMACESGHAIAGVTCNNDRFLYNGWTINTVDKGMKKNFQAPKEPCPLNPIDWARTTNFCINTKECSFNRFISKLNTKELCFSTRTNIALTYVRADYVGERIPSVPKAIDRMKQKQMEEGIFNNNRLFKMGILKADPRTGKVMKAKGY